MHAGTLHENVGYFRITSTSSTIDFNTIYIQINCEFTRFFEENAHLGKSDQYTIFFTHPIVRMYVSDSQLSKYVASRKILNRILQVRNESETLTGELLEYVSSLSEQLRENLFLNDGGSENSNIPGSSGSEVSDDRKMSESQIISNVGVEMGKHDFLEEEIPEDPSNMFLTSQLTNSCGISASVDNTPTVSASGRRGMLSEGEIPEDPRAPFSSTCFPSYCRKSTPKKEISEAGISKTGQCGEIDVLMEGVIPEEPLHQIFPVQQFSCFRGDLCRKCCQEIDEYTDATSLTEPPTSVSTLCEEGRELCGHTLKFVSATILYGLRSRFPLWKGAVAQVVELGCDTLYQARLDPFFWWEHLVADCSLLFFPLAWYVCIKQKVECKIQNVIPSFGWLMFLCLTTGGFKNLPSLLYAQFGHYLTIFAPVYLFRLLRAYIIRFASGSSMTKCYRDEFESQSRTLSTPRLPGNTYSFYVSQARDRALTLFSKKEQIWLTSNSNVVATVVLRRSDSISPDAAVTVEYWVSVFREALLVEIARDGFLHSTDDTTLHK